VAPCDVASVTSSLAGSSFRAPGAGDAPVRPRVPRHRAPRACAAAPPPGGASHHHPLGTCSVKSFCPWHPLAAIPVSGMRRRGLALRSACGLADGAVQVDTPIQPMLKVPGFSSSYLNTTRLLSSFAFNFNLHRGPSSGSRPSFLLGANTTTGAQFLQSLVALFAVASQRW